MKVRFQKLYPWQQAVYMDVTHDSGKGDTYIVKARRQCGKSVVAIAVLLFFAFRTKSIGVCIEPTLNQSRRVFRQIISACGGDKSPLIKSANQTLLHIEFANGSEITFGSQEQGDALRGLTVKYSVLVVDEGAFIDKDTFEVLQPLVDVKRCPVLIISTPLFCSGHFHDTYMRGLNGDKHVHTYDWSKYDTSALLSPEKLEYYRQTLSPLKFLSEYLGEFIKEGSYIFGDSIGKCTGPLSKKPPKYAGIDWSAGDDNDYTVLTLMDEDGTVCNTRSWKDFDSVDLVDAIAVELSKYPSLVTAQVELNSIGKVYRDLLKRKVRKGLLRDFTTTNESKRRIVEQLVEAFQSGQIQVPADPELEKELRHYQIERTPTGKVTYNAMNGVHDDYVVSLALTYDLAKRKGGQKGTVVGYA